MLNLKFKFPHRIIISRLYLPHATIGLTFYIKCTIGQRCSFLVPRNTLFCLVFTLCSGHSFFFFFSSFFLSTWRATLSQAWGIQQEGKERPPLEEFQSTGTEGQVDRYNSAGGVGNTGKVASSILRTREGCLEETF